MILCGVYPKIVGSSSRPIMLWHVILSYNDPLVVVVSQVDLIHVVFYLGFVIRSKGRPSRCVALLVGPDEGSVS